MKNFYVFLIAVLMSGFAFGQDVILTESFETDGQGTRYNASSPFNDGGSDHWNRTDGSNIANITGAYTSQDGSFFWAAEDTDDNGGNGNDEQTIEFTGIDIENFSSISFSGLFGAGNENGAGSSAYDAADYIKITYQIDGGGYQNLIWFSYQDNGDNFNEPIGLDTNFDGTQDGTILTRALQSFTASIPGSGMVLDIRIAVFMDGANEEIAFDLIEIEGIPDIPSCIAPTTQATAYSTTALATTSATLNWTDGDGDEVLVVVKEGSAVDTDPTNGDSYTGNTVFSSGAEIGTGNFVVQSGSSTSSVSITGLAEATTYHVAIYEYNITDTCYLTPALTSSFTTECSTPSDVTAFTATPGNTTIDLVWANGACFDEILVVAKEASAVTVTPTGDGTAYTADANFGDGTDLGGSEFAVFKGSGTSVTVTGLANGTTYHFTAFARKTTTWSSGDSNSAIPVAPPAIVDIVIEDFDGSTPNWSNDIASQQFVDPTTPTEGLFIQGASSNNTNFSGNTAFARDLGGESGEPTLSPYIFTFDAVDVSIYSSMELSFDYHAFANAETGSYEVILDGSGLGPVVYFNDPDIFPGVNGTITVAIPDGTTTVALVLTGTLNGGSDVLELDNFKITGVAPAPVDYIYDGAWLTTDPSGVSNKFDNISIVSGTTAITTTTEAATVTVDSGATLNINSDASITVDSVTNNGTFTLTSSSATFSSLITDAVSGSGELNYERFVNGAGSGLPGTGGNDLISAPVGNEGLFPFATVLGFANNSTVIASSGTLYAFAPFDNTTGSYNVYNTDTPDPASIIAGKGYRMAAGANVTFRGSFSSGPIAIAVNTGAASQWNLIGNPYPSYISSVDFLAANAGVLDASVLDPAAAAIYAYNAGTYTGLDDSIGNFTIINNNTNAALNIAPGQGFYVASNPTGGDVDFTPAMRTTAGTDDFIEGRSSIQMQNYKLVLGLESATNTRTSFYFNENSSRGLDIGYDAAAFGDNANSSPIYSHLVEDNTGRAMSMQSLGATDFEDTVVPLGVNSNQGSQVRFSINQSTLPSTINVYLEDQVNNTMTLLNTSDYVFTPTVDLEGTGRFFLHFNASALSTGSTNLEALNIYTNKTAKTIVIAGQLIESTTANLYDLQGRSVKVAQLETSKTNQTIDTSNLSTGVYVIQLTNGTTSKSQKLIIR